jgi:hypothetical protein
MELVTRIRRPLFLQSLSLSTTVFQRFAFIAIMSKSDDEPSQQHTEDIESQPSKPIPANNHADRAAELIGDQHVEVTEEDVIHLPFSHNLH